MKQSRFHGRVEAEDRQCEAVGCDEQGEFRAPGTRGAGFDGPGEWQWFCLDHVRAFNSRYNWFEGMSAEEIIAAQHPSAGWAASSSTTRAFRADAGVGTAPRWADFDDPLEAISARAGDIRRRAQGRAQGDADNRRFTTDERAAIATLGLQAGFDRGALRRRYTDLVRRYHPDRNGGDRSQEGRLVRVVDAYQLLRKSVAIA